jgi:OmpA-OmpF porin, OOP family
MFVRVPTSMRLRALLTAGLLIVATPALTQEPRDTLFRDTDARLDEARAANAELLAPESFERGMERYEAAEQDLARGRSVERIRAELAEASKQFERAIESSEIARVTLAALLKTRDDALNADAPTFATDLWEDAERAFGSAAWRLESGEVRDARASADQAEGLYRDAELTAIKAQYLSQTRAILAEAEQARVPRYAPVTFARAQALLRQAETQLNENRYDTDLPRSLAQQANYEARHAIFLARQIEQLGDSDATIEDLILRYEEPLMQVAAAADMLARLDAGTDDVAADLIRFIDELREQARQAELDLTDSRLRVAELEEEIRNLDEQLGGVSQERVALVQKLEAEARIRDQFATIETMFDREEARVSREGNSLVLRLVGLTFESGSSVVEDTNRPLLEKVARAASVFSRSELVVEGHTDSYGSDEANLNLSRDRADAVSTYLVENFGIPAFRISSVGYGETQPIANNETPQGRARNRRIDVRIEPEL